VSNFIMPPQNSSSPFAAVGQLSSISAIYCGQVRDGWRGVDVVSLDRGRVMKDTVRSGRG
jgi:hypothetical protein